jgi:hypothetical protein
MNCPKCGSDTTQRLEVIFELGTGHVTTTSRTKVRPFLGILPSASAKTTTKGVTMSKAAQKAQPPAKMQYGFPSAALLIGIAIIALQLDGTFKLLWFVIGLALCGLFGWVLYTGIAYNTKRWPAEYGTWKNSWMCTKCGNIFVEK